MISDRGKDAFSACLIDFFYYTRDWQTFSGMGYIVNILCFVSHMVSTSTMELCCITEGTTDNMYMKKCDYVPIQPYLQNQGPSGLGLSTMVCSPPLAVHLILQS